MMITKLKQLFKAPSPDAMRQHLIDEAQREEIKMRKAVEDLRLQAQNYEQAALMLTRRIARLRGEMGEQV
jgi:hypothetical protein